MLPSWNHMILLWATHLTAGCSCYFLTNILYILLEKAVSSVDNVPHTTRFSLFPICGVPTCVSEKFFNFLPHYVSNHTEKTYFNALHFRQISKKHWVHRKNNSCNLAKER